MSGWESGALALLERLAVASVAGGVLALLVWLACRCLPGIPAAARAWLWWAVAAKLLLGLVPLPELTLPLLPAAKDRVAGEAAALVSGSAGSGSRPATAPGAPMGLEGLAAQPFAVDGAVAAAGPASAEQRRAPVPSPARSAWPVGLALLWGLGAAGALAVAGRDLVAARRLVQRAHPAHGSPEREAFARMAAELRVRGAELRLCAEVEVPQVAGLLRPVVLLPDGSRIGAPRLQGAELEMALAHELLHVRRRDLLAGLVPSLASRLFFFHPFARLAAREHALAREVACDEAVVAIAPSPRAYARMLVRLATAAGPRPAALLGAAGPHNLKRRLEMLQYAPLRCRPLVTWCLAGALLIVLVPVQLVAIPSDPEPAPAPTPEPRGDIVEVRAAAPRAVPAAPGVPRVSAVAPAPRALPAPTALPVPAVAPAPQPGSSFSYRFGSGDGMPYVYLRGARSTVHGTSGEAERARRHRRSDEDLLWVRRGGAEWVIRDPALLAEVERLFGPVHELGRRQGELGSRQGELGALQGELGTRQGELGSRQGELGLGQAELAASQARLAAELAAIRAEESSVRARRHGAEKAEREALDRQRVALEERRRALEARMAEPAAGQRELGERQRALAAEQRAMAERQSELGRQQSELGRRQQAAVAAAEEALERLVDEAIATGRAERAED